MTTLLDPELAPPEPLEGQTEMWGFSFAVFGKPPTKGRARANFKQKRVHADPATKKAERQIRQVWSIEGRPRLGGAVEVHVVFFVDRPGSHFRTDGRTLSAEGQRMPYPSKQKPDVDNALKLVMDALNDRPAKPGREADLGAWKDDVQVVKASVERLWSGPDGPKIMVRASEMREPQVVAVRPAVGT